ncbi:hypothetical protein CU098_001511, partial [Rhizopus stolonifer]
MSNKLFLNKVTRRLFSSSFVLPDKKQFVVFLKDYKDPECLQRRLGVREKHLSGAITANKNGSLQAGGAILDSHQSGKMKGSVMIMSAESTEEVEQMILQDPYTKAKVWESWEIYPFKS